LLAGEGALTGNESAERLLTAEEVAHALGVTKRLVRRRAKRLPFARRISPRAVRYSESGLKRWMSNRTISKA
jgi:predicted DNA-binding transcriptional regulator AlpA